MVLIDAPPPLVFIIKLPKPSNGTKFAMKGGLACLVNVQTFTIFIFNTWIMLKGIYGIALIL